MKSKHQTKSGEFAMTTRFIVTLSVWLVVMSTLSAFAGTWSDGFEHPDLDDEWELYVQIGNQPIWEIENGLLLADQSGQSGLVIGNDEWKDYSVEVTVILLENRAPAPGGSNSRYAGIGMYCKRPLPKGYFLGIYTRLWDGRGPGLLIGVYDGWRPPIASEYKALKVEFGREYRLRMTEEENLIKCYLDGELVHELAMDKSFTSGIVGLAISSMRAHFDDFVVSGANIPDGGPGLGKAVKPRAGFPTTWAYIKQQ